MWKTFNHILASMVKIIGGSASAFSIIKGHRVQADHQVCFYHPYSFVFLCPHTIALPLFTTNYSCHEVVCGIIIQEGIYGDSKNSYFSTICLRLWLYKIILTPTKWNQFHLLWPRSMFRDGPYGFSFQLMLP